MLEERSAYALRKKGTNNEINDRVMGYIRAPKHFIHTKVERRSKTLVAPNVFRYLRVAISNPHLDIGMSPCATF